MFNTAAEIKPYVDEFLAFAKAHPELKFLVTEIGCSIAGAAWGEVPRFARNDGATVGQAPTGLGSYAHSVSHSVPNGTGGWWWGNPVSPPRPVRDGMLLGVYISTLCVFLRVI
jgi:hypothetical protein